MRKAASAVEDRLPPQDLEAEQATLGAVLIDAEALSRARCIVGSEDFYREAHQTIFTAICQVDDGGHPVDPVSVGAELRRLGVLAAVGGAEYLTALMGQVPTTAPVVRYASIVRDCALGRQALRITEDTQRRIYDRSEPVAETVARCGESLSQLAQEATAATGPGYTSAADAAAFLDDITWTWHPWIPDGFLTMIAGEAGIGNSKLALRIVQSVVTPLAWPDGTMGPDRPGKALYIDTEGAQAMHVQRMRAGGLPMDRIFLPGNEADAHLNLSAARTLQFVRYLHEREALSLVVIDSLRSGMPGDENSSEFAEKLVPWTRLARELAAPIIIVHHATKRASEPGMTLARLRGSSAIGALPRSVIAVERAGAAADSIRVHSLKCNLAESPAPFAVQITEHGCEPDALTIPPRRDQQRAEAERFLAEFLSAGPVPAAEVRAEATSRQIHASTLARAREALEVVLRRDPRDGRKTLWELPSQRGEGQ